MQEPLKVAYRNLTASVKYYPSDGLFHAYWNIGGIKGKAASKTIEGAEAKAAGYGACKVCKPPQ